MSADSQNRIRRQRNSIDEHLKEVDRLLESIEHIADDVPSIGYEIETEKTKAYQAGSDWEVETSFTRGYAPLETDDQLTGPEQHALGSQILKDEHGIYATSVAKIKMDGIGEISSIVAEYSIDLDFIEDEGVQYRLERENINAMDPDNQEDVQQDLEYIETQMKTLLNRYNNPGIPQTVTRWEYGREILKNLKD